MSHRYFDRSWSVESDPWLLTAHEECVTLEPASRDSALQISSARKAQGAVSEVDLSAQASKVASDSTTERVDYGRFAGLTLLRTDAEGVLWRYWWLGAKDILLFVTYNAPSAAVLTRDANVVQYILGSLRLNSDDAAS